MKSIELRQKSKEELAEILNETENKLYKHLLEKRQNQLKNVMVLKELRKDKGAMLRDSAWLMLVRYGR